MSRLLVFPGLHNKIRDYLTLQGFELAEASPDFGAEEVAEGGYDVALLALPESSPSEYSLLNRLREFAPLLPLITFTRAKPEGEFTKPDVFASLHQGSTNEEIYRWILAAAKFGQAQQKWARLERENQGFNDRLKSVLNDQVLVFGESERIHRAYIEHSPYGVFVTNATGDYIEVNKTACDQTGYSRAELLSMSFTDLIVPDPEEQAASRERFRGLIREGLLNSEERVLRRDGTEIPLALRSVRLSADRYMAYTTDLTQRKRADHERKVRVDHLAAMDRINRIIAAAESTNITLNRVLEELLQSLQCDRAWLLFPCDPEATEYTIRHESTTADFPGALVVGEPIPVDPRTAELFEHCLEQESMFIMNAEEMRAVPKEIRERFRIQSQMVLPLRPEMGQPWLLGFHQCTHPRPWSESDQRLVEEAGRRIEDALSRLEFQEKLVKSEEWHRILFESSAEAIFLLGSEFEISDCNPAAVRLFGANSKEEIIGHNPAVLSPEFQPDGSSSEEKARHMIEKALGEGSYEFEWLHSRLDGTTFPASVLATRMNWQGRYILQGCIRDITEQKRLEEKMTQYNHLLDRSLHEIYVFDARTLNFLQVNHGARVNLGYSLQELKEMTPLDLKLDFTEETFREVLAPLEEKVLEKVAFTTIHRRRDGSTYPVEVHLQLTNNEPPEYLAIILDITERERLNRERIQLEEQYLQSQKMESIGRLAGGVAHDFNNLLFVILGYGELLLDEIKEDEPQWEALNEIVQAGQRARDMVGQLLAFSRKQTLEFSPVNLSEVVKEFGSLLRRTVREDIEIVIHTADDLPAIDADISQVEQVIMNLAVNGQDAITEGGKITIHTSMVELDARFAEGHPEVSPGHYVLLAVSDTGCGMEEKEKDHIFEPFYTTKEKSKGTGLGLSTVYGIVKQHRGHVLVRSEKGEGTTFEVYLPVKEGAESGFEALSTPSLDLFGTECILLVEDSEPVRELARIILGNHGYRVLTAANGHQALEALEENDCAIQLILTDVVMPDISGKALVTQACQNHPNLKVLYMSGYTDDVIAERGVLPSGVNFLQKPFSAEELAKKVREVLNSP